MKLYTIGFTEKSASEFFGLIKSHRIDTLIDTRLRPQGQLSGFARKADLPFFLRELVNCEYLHLELLAPTDEILKDYRLDKDWERYVDRFERLMDDRDVPGFLDRSLLVDRSLCLLCSEHAPDRCHRRLVADRLATAWGNPEIVHLM